MNDSLLVNVMFCFAVFVQICVFGATKLHTQGALLESWEPYFGLPYACIFLALQIWFCLCRDHRRGLVHLSWLWTGAAVFYIIIRIMQSQTMPSLTAYIALISGLGACLLWAGFHTGKI